MRSETSVSPGVLSRPTVALTLLLALSALSERGWTAPAPQQLGAEPVRTATVTGDEIVVDGSLDEAAWRQAPTIGGLVQRIPNAGAQPDQRTDVKLLHDKDNLYVGVMCYDSEPNRILASQMARDASLNSDDRISIPFDTFRDQSNAFYFSTNPNGALVDGLVFANGETNQD